MSLLERVYAFHNRIMNNRYPNSGDLVREFEVSPATAHRDINYLRDRLLAPLAFSQKKNGYYYTETGFRLPFEDTPQLMLLLGLLQKIAEETGLADLPELRQLQTKLSAIVSTERSNLGDLVHCEWIETESVEPAIFSAVLKGLLAKSVLIISYRTPGGGESERGIEPLKLVNYQGRWYILAWCRLRQAKRMFHLARIARSEQTGETILHELNQYDDWLSGSFGIFKGDAAGRYLAKILFTGTAADIVRRQHWHPEQQLEESENGLILTLPVADDRELLMKVLQFGSQAKVVSPPELKKRIRRELMQATSLYDNPPQKKP